jgi:plasmid maintenance system antidote protein VapI
MLHSKKELMSQEETKKLMAELKAWADGEYGRRAEIARMLGVPRQRVTNWIAGQGTPTLEQGLRLQAFLKKR